MGWGWRWEEGKGGNERERERHTTNFYTIYDLARHGFIDFVNRFLDGFGGRFARDEGRGEGTGGWDAELGGEETGLAGEGAGYGLHFDMRWVVVWFSLYMCVGSSLL